MKPAIIVFLGPSLDIAAAQAILTADFRPPAARGDLTAASEQGARIITLIDGVFFQDCAVGHREILGAISSGIKVIGASSMGALRAAELDGLGMLGAGLIYRLYRDGTLISDDEVALVYDPETFLPLSEPLINIRCTLREAQKAGVLSPGEASILLSGARSLYFPERTYPRISEIAEESISSQVLSAFLDFANKNAVDQKREDAVEALQLTRGVAEDMGIL